MSFSSSSRKATALPIEKIRESLVERLGFFLAMHRRVSLMLSWTYWAFLFLGLSLVGFALASRSSTTDPLLHHAFFDLGGITDVGVHRAVR